MTDQCIATSETLNKLLAEEVLRAKKNNLNYTISTHPC